jgi:tetrahydromethanopterin S-methyltransferase subunit G
MLEKLTETRWFYWLLGLLFFLPIITESPYQGQDTPLIVGEVLSAPLTGKFPWLYPLGKIIFILILFWAGQRLFELYVGLSYLAIAFFQNSAQLPGRGLTILTGNVILMAIVAIFWLLSPGRETSLPKRGKCPLFLLALLAFWLPVDAQGQLSLSVKALAFSDAMLAFCFFTPVILATVMLGEKKVSKAAVKVTGFLGILYGLVNMLTWFWLNVNITLGLLHLPLLLLSGYTYLSQRA